MRALPVLLVGAALVVTACSDDRQGAAPIGDLSPTTTAPDDTTPGDGGPSGGTFVRALAPFADCAAFLDHVRAEASERVGPYGLGGTPGIWLEDDVTWEMSEDAADEAAVPASDGAADAGSDRAGDDGDDGGFTGTNVQEAGVDEADIVKTDGDRILTLAGNVLTHVDISGEEPVVTDRLVLPEGWAHEMFFRGDRAVVLTNGGPWGPVPVEPLAVDDVADAEADFAASSVPIEPPGEFTGPAAVVIEIDLSDPGALRVAGTLRIEGRYLSARAIDDHVRLALTSPPSELPWVYPQGEAGEEVAEETNRRIVAESSLADWTPGYELSTDAGDTSGELLACDRMHHPVDFAGFDVVTVLDLDLAEGLAGGIDRDDAVGVLAAGETVYSSTDRFYVATTSWPIFEIAADGAEVWNEDVETDLHAFAIAAGEPTRYVASGSVDGTLLNQFSMDEFEGRLRVITTDGSPWDGSGASETSLVVLEEQGERLVPIGSVGGLGKGEQLYSARLLDDVGFAVTFRQVDPFYVLDLRDPANPRVTGELKIPGVSTYLHPVGDHRVLGIGQDATEEGRTTGLKLSLFDVSDPADPREISVWTMPGANSAAEWDHRAFQMTGSTAIVPVQEAGFGGAVLFDIGDSITEIGRVAHVGDGTAPSSDCRPVDGAALTPEASELWWMTQEPTAHVQVCGPDDVGGWGDWYCDPIPVDELQYWFGDPERAEADLAAIGATDGDRVELCWDDGDWQRQVKRSLVVDGTLWTMSERHLQANRLDGLDLVANLPIG